MIFNKGPFGGHHLGGDSCPPITFEVVPYSNSWPHLAWARGFGLLVWVIEPLVLVEGWEAAPTLIASQKERHQVKTAGAQD